MKNRGYFSRWFLLLYAACCGLGHSETSLDGNWESSVVTLEVSGKRYDVFQPWTRSVKQASKNGVVVENQRILTTADGLEDNIMVRIQKEGRGQWWEGRIDWVDYHSNLALIRCDQPSFWAGLQPVQLADSISDKTDFTLARWKNGRFELRRAEFNEFVVQSGELFPINHIQLLVTSEIEGAGWSEPLIQNGKIAGLTSAHQEKKSVVIPSLFIRSILDAKNRNEYTGLGYFSFIWQPSSNPETLEFLELEGPQRGALVISVPDLPGRDPVLEPRDIILEVDGFPIDIQGDYLDPDYGYLMLENLSTRNKWAGEVVSLKVWRKGAVVDLDYTLPSIDLSWNLVGNRHYDKAPEFLIAGGLIFQPLTMDLLRSWPRRPPFRLNYYQNEPATDARNGIILLTQILPDAFSLGYEEYRFLPVDSVNDQIISNMSDLLSALSDPKGEHHIVRFMEGSSPGALVLDASEMENATRRILQRYGIPTDSHTQMDR